MLFDQQILVPDELLDAAAAVLEEGEYKRTSDLNRSYIAKGGGRKGEYAFPKSIRLRHTDVPDNFNSPLTLWPLPRHILLLPQSYFALDTRSESRFQSLVPPLDASNAGILVPKYNTFLEGLVHAFIFHDIFIDYLVRYRRRGLRERAILSDIQTEDCTWYMTQSLRRNGFQITIQEHIRQKTLRKSLEAQNSRLVALRQLIARDIPCILWGEDALFLAHSISVSLPDQQILVPDELLETASAILEEGQYQRTSEPHKNYLGRFGPDEGKYAFPKSIRLQHVDIPEDDPYKCWPTPRHILLLPQSYYALDARSASRFQSLGPPLQASNAGILVPKYNTFLEGLVHFLMHPPAGRPSQDAARFHSMFIHYLTVYRSKLVPDVKEDIMSQIQTEDGAWYLNLKLSRRQGVRSHEIEEYKRQKELRRPKSDKNDCITNNNYPFYNGANKIRTQTIREYSMLPSIEQHKNYPAACLQMHAPDSQWISKARTSTRLPCSRALHFKSRTLSHVVRHLIRCFRS
ncbi:hypothetical protein BJ912DRAFT_948298 [Pholiota molesta]|nr:hypothetical protein BJ912DRAFT_948298 [Pholiota molesta]